MGLDKLNERFADPNQRENFLGMFCRDNPKNTRFCINFFTSIGLGALTEELREFLQNAEKMVEEALRLRQLEANMSDSDDSSSSESSSGSESDSASSSNEDDDEKSNSKASDSS
jgi:pre-mRNA-splicing factor CWC22